MSLSALICSLIRGSSNPARDWAQFGEALDALLVALRQAEADRDDAQHLLADCQRGRKAAQDAAFTRGDERDEVLARCVRLETALREAHEVQCGCDQPGRPDFCVASPVSSFEALSAGEVPGSTGDPESGGEDA